MSTYLDFRCKTCGEDADDGIHVSRYGIDNELYLRILANRAHVVALGAALKGTWRGVLLDEFEHLPAFFAAHEGHEVVVVNGYDEELTPLLIGATGGSTS